MRNKTKLLVLSSMAILMFGLPGMAQMMGGSGNSHMGGTGGMGGNNGMGSVNGMGGPMDMTGVMGGAMGMAEGAITVGSDGKLYILSRTFTQTQTTSVSGSAKTKLSAMDPTTGIVSRSIEFDEYWLTRPVQGPDGLLFLVAFGDMGMGDHIFGGAAAQTLNSKLYVVDPNLRTVIKSIELEGEVGSLPTIVGSSSNYTIFVVTFDMGHTGTTQAPQRQSTIYAFRPDGSLLFSRPLNQ